MNYKLPLFLLRVATGWVFLYAGVSKLMDPDWTAAGYLKSAKLVPELYQWLGSNDVIGIVNFLNQWGVVAIGAALILGIGMRLATITGILVMVLYYLPVLQFPYALPHSYLVDDHIIYILVLLVLYSARAGEAWGLSNWANATFYKRPLLRKLLA